MSDTPAQAPRTWLPPIEPVPLDFAPSTLPHTTWEPREEDGGRALVESAWRALRGHRGHHDGVFDVVSWSEGMPGIAVYWYGRVVLLGTAEGDCWLYHPEVKGWRTIFDAWAGEVPIQPSSRLHAATTASPPPTETPIETPEKQSGNAGHSEGKEGHAKPEESYCRAGRDGDCSWWWCPQLRDGEPLHSGRHCPLDSTLAWTGGTQPGRVPEANWDGVRALGERGFNGD